MTTKLYKSIGRGAHELEYVHTPFRAAGPFERLISLSPPQKDRPFVLFSNPVCDKAEEAKQQMREPEMVERDAVPRQDGDGLLDILATCPPDVMARMVSSGVDGSDR